MMACDRIGQQPPQRSQPLVAREKRGSGRGVVDNGTAFTNALLEAVGVLAYIMKLTDEPPRLGTVKITGKTSRRVANGRQVLFHRLPTTIFGDVCKEFHIRSSLW